MNTNRSRSYAKLISNKYSYLALIIPIISVITVLELTNTTHFFHKAHILFPATPTKGGATVTNPKGEVNTQISTSSSTEPGDNKSDAGGSTTPVLSAPSGDFVSNHKPGFSNSPLTEVSVCNTTPGAECQIIFTKDGDIKSLSKQTTDRNGSAYWNEWAPADIGLTPGSWQIKAVATFQGQTRAATDSTNLVVSQ